MWTMRFISVLVTALAALPVMAQGDGPAAIAAINRVERQLNFLQEFFGENTEFSAYTGVFNQTMDLQVSLEGLRQKINNQAGREDIVLAFDGVDKQVSTILSAINGMDLSTAGLRMATRRLKAAESDLHYAMFTGDLTPARRLAILNRQASTQQIYVSCLVNNVSLVFSGKKEVLAGWKDDLSALQKSLTTLQELAQNNGTVPQLREQVLQADNLWDKIMQRYNNAKANRAALQGFVSLVDQRFAKMSNVVGVKDRRAALTSSFPE